MGMNDKVLSHIRMLSNSVVRQSNQKHSWAVMAEVRRTVEGAQIMVSLRPGTVKPADTLLELADVADLIRSDLRLERTKLNQPVYSTSESTFDTVGSPSFTFDVWELLGEITNYKWTGACGGMIG